LADTIAHVKTDRLRDLLDDERTKALDVRLPGTLAEEKAETVVNTLANMEAEALVNILADTLEEEKVELLGDRLGPRHWSSSWLTH